MGAWQLLLLPSASTGSAITTGPPSGARASRARNERTMQDPGD